MSACLKLPGSVSSDLLPVQPSGNARSRRVVLLLLAVVLMSLADLDLTLTYATVSGMFESNPIARLLMRHGTPELVAVWKLSCVGLAVCILFAARERRCGELGAWACVAVLCWLTTRWVDYNRHAPMITAEFATVDEGAWITMRK